jgi:molybdate transport system substrate-binding protein
MPKTSVIPSLSRDGHRLVRSPLLAVLLLVLGIATGGAVNAQTQQHVVLYAAGSLHGALVEIATAFTQQTGIVVDPTYGSSGLLRGRIENGETADVFASADTDSPQRLQAEGKSGAVTVFTRNRMCLLVKSALAGSRNVADLMLDPKLRLVTSTPKADPAGDYAEAIFAKLNAQRPGALATLDAKALRLIGGANAVSIPAGADLAVYLLLTSNQGDTFLAYCPGFVASVAANPTQLRSLEMPADLAVRADYGLTLRNNAPPAALKLRDFILSRAGQAIFVRYGFSRV